MKRSSCRSHRPVSRPVAGSLPSRPGSSLLALSTPSVKRRIARFPFLPASILEGVAATASKRAVLPPASSPSKRREQPRRVAREVGHQAHFLLGEGEQGEVVPGLALADDAPHGRLGVFELAREPHAAGGVDEKSEGDGSVVVALEGVEVDADALNAKLEVLLLEPLDEPPLLVQDEDGHEDVFRPGAFGVGGKFLLRLLPGASRGGDARAGGPRAPSAVSSVSYKGPSGLIIPAYGSPPPCRRRGAPHAPRQPGVGRARVRRTSGSATCG